MAWGGRIDWNNRALEDLLESPGGEVARHLQEQGEKVTQEAKRLAPTSPDGSHGRPSGYLRSAIGWAMGADGAGIYVDVASPATTPSGSPYGLFQEVGWTTRSGRPGKHTPHLRPALDVLR